MKKFISVLLLLLMFSTILYFPTAEVSAKKISVTLNAKNVTLVKDQKTNLKATSSIKSSFKWTTSKKSVATLSKTKTGSGKSVTVKAKGYGTSLVKAIAQDGTKLCVSCKVKVIKKPKLNKTSIYTYNSNTTKLTVSGGTGKIKWSTSNKNIATVSSSGMVTAKKYGTCTITAVRNNVAMKCKVEVSAYYSDFGFQNVYDFGAITGAKLIKTEDGEYDGSYYCDFTYKVDTSKKETLINDYENKIMEKGFVFSSQEEYYYGTTDYYHYYYDNSGEQSSVMVAITDYGNDEVEVSIWV